MPAFKIFLRLQIAVCSSCYHHINVSAKSKFVTMRFMIDFSKLYAPGKKKQKFIKKSNVIFGIGTEIMSVSR